MNDDLIEAAAKRRAWGDGPKQPLSEFSTDWTEPEWENCEHLAARLLSLLKNPDRANRVWRVKLKLALESLGCFITD